MSGESMIDRFSETRDWSTSACRAISWHPNANKLALAANDDTIQVIHVFRQFLDCCT